LFQDLAKEHGKKEDTIDDFYSNLQADLFAGISKE